MKFAIIIKNRIENIYKKFPRVTGYIGRFAFTLCCLLILRTCCSYSELALLTGVWSAPVLSVFCAFAPARLLMLIIETYIVIQMFSLSIEVGLVAAAILLVIYLIFFRFDRSYIYLIMLIPLTSIIRLPVLMVLVLGVTGSLDSAAVVIFGNLIYYMIRYININAATITGMANEESISRLSYVARGIFTYTEFLYMLAIMIVVFLLTYFLRRMNINQANYLALTAGSGVYVILCIIANLVTSAMTAQRLVNIVAGGIISGLIAAFTVYAVLPLDYTRLETFEFEDDEYHYYVRAVPKAVIKRETVKVKKINSRKEVNLSKRGKENSQ